MADKKIVDLTALVTQATTDLYETSANGAGSFKETRTQQKDYWDANIVLEGTDQVTGLDAALTAKLNLAGGTMTGALVLAADPVVALGAATKQYVDGLVSTTTMFSAYQSPQQSIPNNSETVVNFQSTEFNVGSGFAANVFTAPDDGFYYFPIKGAMAAPGTADTQVTWRLYQDSTLVAEDNQVILVGDVDRSFNLSKLLQLTAGQEVEVRCLITGNGGNALSVNNAVGSTYFQGYLVTGGVINKTPIAVTGVTKTFSILDAFTTQVCSNASPQVLTIPLNATVAFPIGTQIDIIWDGVGEVSVDIIGGVTLHSVLENRALAVRYAQASLIKTATDEWRLAGMLAA